MNTRYLEQDNHPILNFWEFQLDIMSVLSLDFLKFVHLY